MRLRDADMAGIKTLMVDAFSTTQDPIRHQPNIIQDAGEMAGGNCAVIDTDLPGLAFIWQGISKNLYYLQSFQLKQF